jgi:hypothetical protein
MAEIDAAAVRVRRRAGQRQSARLPLLSVTLSADNAASRSRPSPDPCPTANGARGPSTAARRPIPAAFLHDCFNAIPPMRDDHRHIPTTTRPAEAQPER